MQILIAEDDADSRNLLQRTLSAWGHEVAVVCDGAAAWEILQREDAPKLAILDWMMPELEGVEICRRVRKLERNEPTYLIMLTAKHQTEDRVMGLEEGANDYMTKPFDHRELRSRITVAERITSLQRELAQRVHDLELAIAHVHQLRGLLPICSYCKSVRDDQNYWQKVETYLMSCADVQFSHGICPECYEKLLPELEALESAAKLRTTGLT